MGVGRQQQDLLQLSVMGGLQGFCDGIAGNVPHEPILVPADLGPPGSPTSPPVRPRQDVVRLEPCAYAGRTSHLACELRPLDESNQITILDPSTPGRRRSGSGRRHRSCPTRSPCTGCKWKTGSCRDTPTVVPAGNSGPECRTLAVGNGGGSCRRRASHRLEHRTRLRLQPRVHQLRAT